MKCAKSAFKDASVRVATDRIPQSRLDKAVAVVALREPTAKYPALSKDNYDNYF